MNPNLPDLRGESAGLLAVALCQVHTREWDMEGNTKRTLAALEEAARLGADVAITPECVLHGYGFGDGPADTLARTRAAAEPIDGPRLAAVRDIARRTKMHVVLGFAHAAPDGTLRNAAALISDTGSLADIYHKVHLRPVESVEQTGPYTPGDRFAVAAIARRDLHARVGAMICFDREVPESARCLRAMGAQFIACPLAWYTLALDAHHDFAHNEMVTRCRAAENEVFIAVVNHAGRFNGGSFVVGPGGETITQLGPGEDVRVVRLPLAALQARVHGNPLGWMGWGYRRQTVYDRHLASR